MAFFFKRMFTSLVMNDFFCCGTPASRLCSFALYISDGRLNSVATLTLSYHGVCVTSYVDIVLYCHCSCSTLFWLSSLSTCHAARQIWHRLAFESTFITGATSNTLAILTVVDLTMSNWPMLHSNHNLYFTSVDGKYVCIKYNIIHLIINSYIMMVSN